MASLLRLLGLETLGAVRRLAATRSDERRARATIASAPRLAISDVKTHTIVKVIGRLRYLGVPLTAPLTGRTCAYYSAVVTHHLGLAVRDDDRRDFLIEDGTGRAIVRLRSDPAAVTVTKDANFRVGEVGADDRELYAFLRWNGRVPGGLFGGARSFQFREGVLEAEEDVAVCGVGYWEVDPDANAWAVGYRDFPRRLALSPLPDGKIYISDEPETF